MKTPELLSPAGNPEKLDYALLYGADAVYFAGNDFGMRAAAGNFTNDEIKAAAKRAHDCGARAYITLNVMPHTNEYPALREYIKFLATSGIDAVIVSDVGVLAELKELAPDLEVHISTQASAVSAAACRAWHAMGAKRVVLARELTFDEIREIRDNTPPTLELEAFIHGSMCISYSGRCLLSNYFTGRDANRGACAQPCRWNFNAVGADLQIRDLRIAEEKRMDDVLSVEEDVRGAYIMSSRDMCMIEHVPALMAAGIDSFKIEGRMKSAYYTAVTTNAYRCAIDSVLRDGTYDPAPLMRELMSVSHRAYSTGFYFNHPGEDANCVTEGGYIREKAYLATAEAYDPETGRALFLQRNKLSAGEGVELITPGMTGRAFTAEEMTDEAGERIESAPHPLMLFWLKVPFPVKKGDILRGV